MGFCGGAQQSNRRSSLHDFPPILTLPLPAPVPASASGLRKAHIKDLNPICDVLGLSQKGPSCSGLQTQKIATRVYRTRPPLNPANRKREHRQPGCLLGMFPPGCRKRKELYLTVSSVHCVVLALSFVQYLTCRVPDDRPGKYSAICFQVSALPSFRSTSFASSSGVNFSFGPRGRGAGDGIPWTPPVEGPDIPSTGLKLIDVPPVLVRAIFAGGG